MKKTISYFLVAMLALVLVFSLSTTALAADSINTSVKISPTTLPGEGTASVSVTIKNNGDPITNVQLKYPSPTDTVIELGNMASGDSKTHNNDAWNISSQMLDTSMAFTVLWTSSDGTQKSGNTQSFQINKQDLVIKVSGTAAADMNEVDKGGRVKFSFSFKNEGNAPLTNCVMTAPMIDNGAQIGDTFSLDPGSTNNKTYTVVVNENMTVTPTYTYEVNGQQYTYKTAPINITVKEPPKTITMGVTLNADKTTVPAGDHVNFTIKVTNTGTSNLDGLTATDFEGKTVPLSPVSLQPGGVASATTSIPINTTGNYQFTVAAVGAGGETLSQRSNSLLITVEGTAVPSASPDDILDPSRIIRTEVQVPRSPQYGPSEGTFIATVTNLTDKELRNVLVTNDLIGTLGRVDTLAGGASKTFEAKYTMEETASYVFVTTAVLPDGTLIESKTNEATIVVEPAAGGMDTTTTWFIIILIAIAAVGISLAVYIYKSRKKIKAQDAARDERASRMAGNYRLDENGKPSPIDYPSAEQRSRVYGKAQAPDRSAYTNRKPPPRMETLDPKPRTVPKPGLKATPPKGKTTTKFDDRNKL